MTEEEKVFNELQDYLKNKNVQLKIPENADKVYKDECVYCFDTPFNPDGLFISLVDYVGVCAKHIEKYVNKTSKRIFLNIKKFKLSSPDESEEPKDKIQRLCIKENQEQIASEHTLRLYPYLNKQIKLSAQLDTALVEVCDQIVAHISAEIQQRLQSGISEWDGEERPISLAANDLVQIKYDGPPINYDSGTCSVHDCGLKENLWLNLSDGVICCGRFSAPTVGGQKGNGHAKKHYEDTGFPLVVKLGTIDNGDGDLYSYSEDSPVRDPNLKEHLAFFGLDIDQFKKTEKTTLELELDVNMKHEFSAIQEEGAKLENVYGPGFTGLINLGSSCYMNSALQMLYNVPDFLSIYGKNAETILSRPDPAQTYEDFNCQLAKVIGAMLGGQYSKKDSPEIGIRPTIFRRLAGRGHVEFSTAKQQDAEEYIHHLFDKIEQNIPQGGVNPVDEFRYQMVTRFEDIQSKHVRYTTREETVLSVPIPRDKFRRSSIVVEGANVERAVISLNECIAAAFGDDFIEGYMSPVTNLPGRANQEHRMASFPDFLIIQLRRFEANAANNFEVKKIDVDVEVTDYIELTGFRGNATLQPDEQPLPDVESGNDEGSQTTAEKENINQLCELGFTLHQAKFALGRHEWNAGVAADWLFNHVDEVPPELKSQEKNVAAALNLQVAKREMRDGPGKYRLRAFISHMGSSPHSGHYVAHVKRDNGVWYIFNDEKVAISQNPPKSLGYLYLYQRK